ncbi:MAG: adenine phosphoribosyltransferase [Actinobacteria bacterium]|nr:adenine phosphoribosyltransferase [Actinomycetota bacterium]
MSALDRLIRVIPDWPSQGVTFQDLTGVLADSQGLREITEELAAPFANQKIDVVAGMEARGFIVGAAVARQLDVGFIALRKAGKLPGIVHSATYALEYGTATLQVHQEDVKAGTRVLIIDDVLATGGTAKAAAQLIESGGAEVVGFGFILALDFLNGSEKISQYPIHSLRTIYA